MTADFAKPVVKAAYDVIVLGAGAGGMAAAALAATSGLSVLLVEKTGQFGGTTAISGGMVWIPANGLMREAGLADDLDSARRYLANVIGVAPGPLLETFLQNAAAAVEALEQRTSVRFRPVVSYPDYYPDRDGATLGGRVLEPVPFDGTELGGSFGLLRPPLPEFTLFGGMMVDRADIPHFRRIGRSLGSTLRVARLTARYAWQRLSHPRGTTLVLGNALAARLMLSLMRAGVDVVLNSRATKLVRSAGAVSGLLLETGGRSMEVAARRGVVIATGGFSHDEALRAQYLPAEARLSAAISADSGDGIALAREAGAHLREGARGNAFWVPVSRHVRRDGSAGLFPHTVTDRAKPGLIAVDRSGRRFTNEARSYHDFVLAMLKTGNDAPALPAYLVCDARFLRIYGLGAIKPFALSVRRQIASGYLRTASDLGSLAATLGIDPAEFCATIAAYNDQARLGRDPAFGRGGDAYQRHLGDSDVAPNPCVAPIERAPFYAIEVHPGDLGTAAGLATDARAQVLSADGTPVGGLYACGNDMSSVMEGAYPGPGITLGPALTFAYIAAETLAAS